MVRKVKPASGPSANDFMLAPILTLPDSQSMPCSAAAHREKVATHNMG
jgi:hypothetical protein